MFCLKSALAIFLWNKCHIVWYFINTEPFLSVSKFAKINIRPKIMYRLYLIIFLTKRIMIMHSKLMRFEIYFACTPWTFSLELHFFSRPLNVKFKGMVTHFPPSALRMLFWLENRDPDVELWALRVRPAKRGWEPSLGGTGSPTVSTGTFTFHSSPAPLTASDIPQRGLTASPQEPSRSQSG